MRPATVVLAWAAFNAALTVMLLLFGEHLLFVGLYAFAVTLVVAIAAAVHLARGSPSARQGGRLPTASLSMFYGALAVVLTGLGFVYGYWYVGLAVVAVVAAAVQFRRERLPAGVTVAPTEVPTLHELRPRRGESGEDRLSRGVKAAAVLAITARVGASVRRWMRGARS